MKKESALDDFGISQPIQIAKDAKIRGFTMRRASCGEKAKGVTGSRFGAAEEIKRDSWILSAISAETGIEVDFPVKICGGTSCLKE